MVDLPTIATCSLASQKPRPQLHKKTHAQCHHHIFTFIGFCSFVPSLVLLLTNDTSLSQMNTHLQIEECNAIHLSLSPPLSISVNVHGWLLRRLFAEVSCNSVSIFETDVGWICMRMGYGSLRSEKMCVLYAFRYTNISLVDVHACVKRLPYPIHTLFVHKCV